MGREASSASEKKAILDAERRYGGVGLHLVRRLAEKYEAEITVTDRVKGRPRQGLEVTIEFKLSDPRRIIVDSIQ